MISYFGRKSFDQQIREAEAHLRRIAKDPKYGPDSDFFKDRAKALDIQKKNYMRINPRKRSAV